MPDDHFDERVARNYESLWPHTRDPAILDTAVDFLAELAGGGPVLELGIGTGRLALPLADRGLRVFGIDLSPAMVAQLRSQPGADAVEVTIGDFATTRVERTFRLAYLVRNTIMNLTSQDAQVETFLNVAAQLEAGGLFVIEVMVPELRRLPPGETVRTFSLSPEHVGLEEYVDLVDQISYSHHYWPKGGEVATFSAPFRYVWPSELDLMARLAGMTLRERWSDWKRSSFTSDSRQHVSVWEKTSLSTQRS